MMETAGRLFFPTGCVPSEILLRNGKYISQQKAVNRDNEPHAGRIAEPGGHRPRPDI